MKTGRDCPTCGEHHVECNEDLLNGMFSMAIEDARRKLSEQGIEILLMLEYAAETSGWAEAWNAAEGIEKLPVDEIRTLEAYVARVTLIEAMQEQLYEEVS